MQPPATLRQSGGAIELAIPKLRTGSYFPDWLLEPRRRAERALVAVIQEAYPKGVSTRKVDDLVRAMGASGISKSEVSRLVRRLKRLPGGDIGAHGKHLGHSGAACWRRRRRAQARHRADGPPRADNGCSTVCRPSRSN